MSPSISLLNGVGETLIRAVVEIFLLKKG